MLALSITLMMYLYPLFLMTCFMHHAFTDHFLSTVIICSVLSLLILLFHIWAKHRFLQATTKRRLRWWLRLWLVLIPIIFCALFLILFASLVICTDVVVHGSSDGAAGSFIVYWLIAYFLMPVMLMPAFLLSYRNANANVFKPELAAPGSMKYTFRRICCYLYPES